MRKATNIDTFLLIFCLFYNFEFPSTVQIFIFQSVF